MTDADQKPMPAKLHCPHCGRRHVDKGHWIEKAHTTHLCEFCDGEFDVSHPQCFGVADPQPNGFVPSARTTHELKTWRKEFQAMLTGEKTFDIRNTRDRKFAVGDIVHFREWDHVGERYTGASCARVITYIITGPDWGLDPDMCVLALDTGRVDELLADNTRYRNRAQAAEVSIGALRAARDAIRQPLQIVMSAVGNIATIAEKMQSELSAMVLESSEAISVAIKRIDAELGGEPVPYQVLVERLARVEAACDAFEANSAGAAAEFEAKTKLMAAIREHRDQRGHDRCWLDDEKLYTKLLAVSQDAQDDVPAHVDGFLPPKESFLKGCETYFELRKQGVKEEHCGLATVVAALKELKESVEFVMPLLDESFKRVAPRSQVTIKNAIKEAEKIVGKSLMGEVNDGS